MNTQVGERYKCSDANCACEIEVTKPSHLQNESFSSTSMNAGSPNDSSQTNRPIGGSAADETGVGTLRNAESAGISTPGDFGSQGATGEGVFGTSGGNQRSTASGRLGSTTGSSLRSNSPRSSTSNIEAGSTTVESNFYCVCGQPMQRAQPASRAASARP